VLVVDDPAKLEFIKFSDECIVKKVASSSEKLMISGLPRALSICHHTAVGEAAQGSPFMILNLSSRHREAASFQTSDVSTAPWAVATWDLLGFLTGLIPRDRPSPAAGCRGFAAFPPGGASEEPAKHGTKSKRSAEENKNNFVPARYRRTDHYGILNESLNGLR
jgi:hypothetical protein